MLVQNNSQLKDELILDDRWDLNFGRKMKEATLWGAPLKIILGKITWKMKSSRLRRAMAKAYASMRPVYSTLSQTEHFQLSRSTTECYANKPYTYNQLLTLKTKSS